MKEFFRPIESIHTYKATSDVEGEGAKRAIRIYRSFNNGVDSRWEFQIRAPLSLVNRRDGKDFVIAGANLGKTDLLAIRTAIDEALSDA